MEDTKVHDYTSSVSMVTAILLGKRCHEKALIGNTMLGNECFSSQTSKCHLIVYQEEGQICDIINTPDLYHGPKLDPEEEALPQTRLFYSGERVFLLILQHDNISAEEMTMFAKLKETYGETIVDQVIVVLDTSNASQPVVDENIQRILHECGGRVCYFKRGMKKDELNNQLLSTFKRMLKKNAPDRLDTTSVEPRHKTSENAEEKPAAAAPEEQKTSPAPEGRKMLPNVEESLHRSNRLHKTFQDKKAQSNLSDEEAGAAVPKIKTEAEHGRIYNIPNEFKMKADEAVPGGNNVEGMKYEAMVRSNHNSLAKTPGMKKVQPKSTDEKTGAAAAEEKMTEEKIYEKVLESKNSSYESMDKCSHYTMVKEPEKKNRPAVPTAKPPALSDVLTIVLLGQTGSGKSATGNTILAKNRFESRASSSPVTQQCEVAEGFVCGIKVRVIDTPDFFDEDLENPKLHIQKCKDLSEAQPVVYLLVMHMGRFTEGEREAVSNMQRTFGEQVVRQTVVLFTGKEKLRQMSLFSYIKNADPQLHQLVQTFGARIFALNNNDKRQYQVKDLVKLLMEMPVGDRIKEQYNRYRADLKECRIL